MGWQLKTNEVHFINFDANLYCDTVRVSIVFVISNGQH